MIFILGYALTTEVKNIDFAVVDQSDDAREPLAHRNRAQQPRSSAGTGLSATAEEARRGIDNGDIKAALVSRPISPATLRQKRAAQVQLLVDGQDANSANVSRGYLTRSFRAVGAWSVSGSPSKARGVRVESLIPVTVSPVILFNPLLKSTWYMVPALVVILVTIITGLLSGLSIVKEKEAGTLEQLMVTPVEPHHVIVGKTVPIFSSALPRSASSSRWRCSGSASRSGETFSFCSCSASCT